MTQEEAENFVAKVKYNKKLSEIMKKSSTANKDISEAKERVPETIEELVGIYIAYTGEANCREALRLMEVPDHGALHNGLGRFIRNKFSLWDPASAKLRLDIWNKIGPEKRAYYNTHWKKYGQGDIYQGTTMHADDASSEIIDLIWEEMKRRFK